MLHIARLWAIRLLTRLSLHRELLPTRALLLVDSLQKQEETQEIGLRPSPSGMAMQASYPASLRGPPGSGFMRRPGARNNGLRDASYSAGAAAGSFLPKLGVSVRSTK